MRYTHEGTFKAVHMNWRMCHSHDAPSEVHNDPKKQKHKESLATVAQQVIAIQQVYLLEGWHIFHFDGSAKYCNHYPNDKKRTRNQTSGKSR